MKELPPAFRTIPSVVENAELRLGGDAADVRRTFRGRYALAHFAGPLGGPYGATLSRMDGERVDVLAGVLLSARSEGVSALCVSAGIDPPSTATPAAAR